MITSNILQPSRSWPFAAYSSPRVHFSKHPLEIPDGFESIPAISEAAGYDRWARTGGGTFQFVTNAGLQLSRAEPTRPAPPIEPK